MAYLKKNRFDGVKISLEIPGELMGVFEVIYIWFQNHFVPKKSITD